jgi:hypothetical protein
LRQADAARQTLSQNPDRIIKQPAKSGRAGAMHGDKGLNFHRARQMIGDRLKKHMLRWYKKNANEAHAL